MDFQPWLLFKAHRGDEVAIKDVESSLDSDEIEREGFAYDVMPCRREPRARRRTRAITAELDGIKRGQSARRRESTCC